MYRKRAVRWVTGFILLTIFSAVLFVMDLTSGSSSMTINELIGVLGEAGADSPAGRIVFDIRLPRALAALILGGALSVSGFLLQSFFGNPIAGPYVLGISSGA